MKTVQDKLCDYLEEQVENTCEGLCFDNHKIGLDSVTKIAVAILSELSDKEYLEQLEYNLRLIADKVKEFSNGC